MNTLLRCSGMARVLNGSHSFTCTQCLHPLTEWTIPAFALPAEAGTHLPTPEGWKAELALGGWLVKYRNKCPAPVPVKINCRCPLLQNNSTPNRPRVVIFMLELQLLTHLVTVHIYLIPHPPNHPLPQYCIQCSPYFPQVYAKGQSI